MNTMSSPMEKRKLELTEELYNKLLLEARRFAWAYFRNRIEFSNKIYELTLEEPEFQSCYLRGLVVTSAHWGVGTSGSYGLLRIPKGPYINFWLGTITEGAIHSSVSLTIVLKKENKNA